MIITIDEAIKHCEEVADRCEYEASRYDMTDAYESHMACEEGVCGEKYRRFAEWLKELKKFREQETCEDCISKEAVLAMSDYIGETPTYSNPYAKLEEVVRVENIKSLPPVRPKIKTGHWIDHPQGEQCSECGLYVTNRHNDNWCPNCGSYNRNEVIK